MILRLLNRAASLLQTSIVDSNTDQTAGAIPQSFTNQRVKQGMRIPFGARMRKVFAPPAGLLAPGGQIMRDRVERPGQSREPIPWRTARRKVRCCAKTALQGWTISNQHSSSAGGGEGKCGVITFSSI